MCIKIGRKKNYQKWTRPWQISLIYITLTSWSWIMNWIQKYFRIEGRSGFRRLSLFLASSHPGQNSHAFVVGIWYVVPQEQVRWNWILSNSSLESGTLQCWVAFYYWTLNVVGKELFFYGWTGGRSHVLSWELTRLSGCADGVQNVLWPDL